MPSLNASGCAERGCPARSVAGGRCGPHARLTEQRRGSARTRGYDADWEVLRAAHLLEQPYCVLCEVDGHPWKVATDVDHIVSIRRAPHRRLDPTNLRSLCHAHHSQHTAFKDGGFGR